MWGHAAHQPNQQVSRVKAGETALKCNGKTVHKMDDLLGCVRTLCQPPCLPQLGGIQPDNPIGQSAFFDSNKQYVLDNGIKDTVRIAGIGGVNYFDCYKLENMKISLGGHTLEIPEIVVKSEQEAGLGGHYECIIGLRTLMLYSFVRFNLVDFVLTTGISKDAHLR